MDCMFYSLKRKVLDQLLIAVRDKVQEIGVIFLKLMKKIRKKRILFIVENIQSWSNFKSTYEALSLNKKFRLMVLICPAKDYRLKDDWQGEHIKIAKFLQKNKIKFQSGMRDGCRIDLRDFDPALVFFQHPYDCLRDAK